MKVDKFDFNLPEELIAQSPLKERSSSRLMVVNRGNDTINHKTFPDILNYLNEGDSLVLNNTKVLPARLFGEKEETGAKVEVLLLNERKQDEWEVLVKPAKKVKKGTAIQFGEGLLKAVCTEELEQGGRMIRFEYEGIFIEILDKLGEMPLPPYIKEQLDDRDRYQTVYAKELGSAAAPTAGLHFTEDLLEQIKAKGVLITYITLHVGLGTFRPVQAETIEDHDMHSEYYIIDQQTANLLNETKKRGRKIFAVGTTTVRTLETVANKENGQFKENSGWTNIFIYPPYKFQAVDAMITNFHLPKSTLMMLVSAFSSRETILNAYEEAIDKRYRFFSFGDAMLIL